MQSARIDLDHLVEPAAGPTDSRNSNRTGNRPVPRVDDKERIRPHRRAWALRGIRRFSVITEEEVNCLVSLRWRGTRRSWVPAPTFHPVWQRRCHGRLDLARRERALLVVAHELARLDLS